MCTASGDDYFAELYALEAAPLTSQCDVRVVQGIVDQVREENNPGYDSSMWNSTVSEIQGTYDCLGIN